MGGGGQISITLFKTRAYFESNDLGVSHILDIIYSAHLKPGLTKAVQTKSSTDK